MLLQSKHPHVLYEYKDNTPQGCAVTESYSGGYERGKRSHLQQPKSLHDDLLQEEEEEEELLLKVGEKMVKRDVRSVKKFIEVALVLDKAMFDKRPHSSRKDVIHDAIQVVNIADLVSGFPQRKIDLTIRVERTRFRNEAITEVFFINMHFCLKKLQMSHFLLSANRKGLLIIYMQVLYGLLNKLLHKENCIIVGNSCFQTTKNDYYANFSNKHTFL